jgi:hypothetical protein
MLNLIFESAKIQLSILIIKFVGCFFDFNGFYAIMNVI